MTLTIESTAIKLRAAFQIGLQHRKDGKAITTKADWHKDRVNTGTREEHDLIEDCYLAYSKGYRSFVPTPREVTVKNGW